MPISASQYPIFQASAWSTEHKIIDNCWIFPDQRRADSSLLTNKSKQGAKQSNETATCPLSWIADGQTYCAVQFKGQEAINPSILVPRTLRSRGKWNQGIWRLPGFWQWGWCTNPLSAIWNSWQPSEFICFSSACLEAGTSEKDHANGRQSWKHNSWTADCPSAVTFKWLAALFGKGECTQIKAKWDQLLFAPSLYQ